MSYVLWGGTPREHERERTTRVGATGSARPGPRHNANYVHFSFLSTLAALTTTVPCVYYGSGLDRSSTSSIMSHNFD